ncbi:hypothetical protein [Streptomyces sp. B5E4]|uniref:hypothetical protein n=1 Tax=Streptomyces sp. B5E4 TaxID=3153568 RepID=UPI00325E4B3B
MTVQLVSPREDVGLLDVVDHRPLFAERHGEAAAEGGVTGPGAVRRRARGTYGTWSRRRPTCGRRPS